MSRRPFNPVFWALAHLGSRVRVPSPRFALIAGAPARETVSVPTRHGPVRCVVQRPGAGDPNPPVLLHLHGGGFVNRHPEQDLHIAQHLATRLGVVVVLPDYDTAPAVSYPVAEEQMLDVAQWARSGGRGWDGQRLLLSGISAGAKLAINICQLGPRPVAVSLVVPFTDATRADRTSPGHRAAISPFVQRFVQWSYFPDAGRRREPLASPRHDPSLAALMPPTIIQTGALDTLAAEGRELADSLRAAGVQVVFHEHDAADHDFYTTRSVLQVLDAIVAFFEPRLPRAREEQGF
ncbi:alpha/beta hydrolase fold domain-containing protein [Catenuloplanes sp. NPDC051500]|uniref:alpha/beta hydrolase fold domain-containing protein n=1 Tax=Catenuloplanes sp. NPDC051500 TaxID=3363959 RepID=UPI0037A4AD4E